MNVSKHHPNYSDREHCRQLCLSGANAPGECLRVGPKQVCVLEWFGACGSDRSKYVHLNGLAETTVLGKMLRLPVLGVEMGGSRSAAFAYGPWESVCSYSANDS
jgi:hypothetical protein